jgi:hypothetical protein
MTADGKIKSPTQLSLGDGFVLVDNSDHISPAEKAAREESARGALMHLFHRNINGWKGDNPSKIVPEDGKPPSWMQDLVLLMERGWPWRQAVYIAWEASPRLSRWPETQTLLATEVLGLSSDRVISEWKRKNPAIDTMVAALQSHKVFAYRGDAYEALVLSAATPDYKGHKDREMLFEMTGDWERKTKVTATINGGRGRAVNEFSDMSDEELQAYIEANTVDAEFEEKK